MAALRLQQNCAHGTAPNDGAQRVLPLGLGGSYFRKSLCMWGRSVLVVAEERTQKRIAERQCRSAT
jgi:hypothetical protein